MRSKFVIRLLAESGEMLGWQEVQALARGDGAMWLEEATGVPIDFPGKVVRVSVHWADVNIEIRYDVPVQEVKRGDSITVQAGELVRLGPAAGGLPPVMTRNNAVIGIPVGSLSAVGSR